MYLSLRCVERDVTCRVCNYCVFRISCSRCYRYCWRLNCWSVKESVRPISRLYYPTLPSSRFLLLIKSKQILWRQKYIFLKFHVCGRWYKPLTHAQEIGASILHYVLMQVHASACTKMYAMKLCSFQCKKNVQIKTCTGKHVRLTNFLSMWYYRCFVLPNFPAHFVVLLSVDCFSCLLQVKCLVLVISMY